MISWKLTRTISVLLLLLPLVHLTYLMTRDTVESLDNSPQAWSREMKEYAEHDARSSLPEKPVLVVGGRRVKLWHSLEELIQVRPVLMRGLGDAIIEDITFNYDRLIGFYQPDTLVVLPGNSEFHVRDNKSSEELVGAIQALSSMDESYGITRRLLVIAPIKTLLRPQDHATIDHSIALLRDWAKTDIRVRVLDPNPLLADKSGQPRDYYFRGDGVNLNEHGYLRLSILLLTALESDAAPVETALLAP